MEKQYPNHIGILLDSNTWMSSQTSTGVAPVAMTQGWWSRRSKQSLHYRAITNCDAGTHCSSLPCCSRVRASETGPLPRIYQFSACSGWRKCCAPVAAEPVLNETGKTLEFTRDHIENLVAGNCNSAPGYDLLRAQSAQEIFALALSYNLVDGNWGHVTMKRHHRKRSVD